MSSPSIVNRDYWWYRARSSLLEKVFAHYLNDGDFVIDIGSADGPSVRWVTQSATRVALDIDPTGLVNEPRGVCASALRMPFQNDSADVITAFDVLEHFESDVNGLSELRRVLRPGGVLLISVPAYEWAWTSFDERQGHHRRYTKRRLVELLRSSGFVVDRATYAFASVFPMFTLERLLTRTTSREPEDPAVSQLPEWVGDSLEWLSRLDQKLLERFDLPFGSSIFAAAVSTSGPWRAGGKAPYILTS